MRRLMSGALLFLVFTVAGCGSAPQLAQEHGRSSVGSPGIAKLSHGETQSSSADSSLGSTGSAADLVAKLQAKGWKAKLTGEQIPPLFGAKSAEVVSADGIMVQVYVFEDVAAADQGFKMASDPQAHTVQWAANPHFVRTENLLVTIVTNDEAAAGKITAALQP
jgi:hypothetical protein